MVVTSSLMHIAHSNPSSLKNYFSVPLLVSALFFPPVTAATDIVPFAGFRGGGEFADLNSGAEIKISEAQSYGIVVDTQLSSGNIVEFYLSRQPTKLVSDDPLAPGTLFDMDVDYLHFGGKSYINKEDGTFLVGTLGLTHFNPDAAGFDAATKFSIGLGIGIEFGGDGPIGFRLEGRGFGTFLNSDGAIFCGGSSGGCTIITSSDVLWQYEMNAGLIFRF